MRPGLGTPRIQMGAFLIGNGVSLIGNTLTLVGLPWFVLQTTGSAGKTGLTGMAFALPAFLAGLFGGILIDRLGGRRMSAIADVVSGTSVALIPLLHLTVGLSFWQLLILVFFGAMLDIPGLTARRTMLPQLSERAGIRPEAMNSAFETTDAFAIIVGPAIAGLLIAWIGAVNLLLFDAATFAISALLIGLVVPDTIAATARDDDMVEGVGSAWSEILAGLHFIRADRLLLALALILVFTNFFNGPFFTVIMPVIVNDRYGAASEYGLLLTAFGIGSLMGGAAYGAFGHRLRAHRLELWLVGFASVAVIRWLLVPDYPYVLLLATMALAGLLSGPVNPLLVTVRFERIPVHLRGRVFATFAALASIADPLGMATVGYAIEQVGLHETLVVTAVLFTALVLIVPFIRVIRQMNLPAAEGDPETVTPPRE
ncbi:MAG TPA: MFS transporter [Thermomicrobiales bacterium]|nr:MFS transporter [Thermomicrobiales bacterium]